jgi:hypothetical protein
MKRALTLLVCMSLATSALAGDFSQRQGRAVSRKADSKRHKPAPKKGAAAKDLQKAAEGDARKHAQAAGYQQYQMRLQAEERGRIEYLNARNN